MKIIDFLRPHIMQYTYNRYALEIAHEQYQCPKHRSKRDRVALCEQIGRAARM